MDTWNCVTAPAPDPHIDASANGRQCTRGAPFASLQQFLNSLHPARMAASAAVRCSSSTGHECSYDGLGIDAVRAGFRGARILFVGDSASRGLVYQLVAALALVSAASTGQEFPLLKYARELFDPATLRNDTNYLAREAGLWKAAQSTNRPGLLRLTTKSGLTRVDLPQLNASLGFYAGPHAAECGSMGDSSYYQSFAGRGFWQPEGLLQAVAASGWRPTLVYAQTANHLLHLYPMSPWHIAGKMQTALDYGRTLDAFATAVLRGLPADVPLVWSTANWLCEAKQHTDSHGTSTPYAEVLRRWMSPEMPDMPSCLQDNMPTVRALGESAARTACHDHVFSVRGLRHLNAQAKAVLGGLGARVHVLDSYAITEGKCEYTQNGDGRHYAALDGAKLRVLLSVLQAPPPFVSGAEVAPRVPAVPEVEAYSDPDNLDSWGEKRCVKMASKSPMVVVKKQRPMVVVLGMPKSGTESINSFLKCSGWNSSHWSCGVDTAGRQAFCGHCMLRWVMEMSGSNTTNGAAALKRQCGNFNAFGQIDYEPMGACIFPQVSHLHTLIRYLPDACFVLNTRPTTRWLASVHHWGVGELNMERRLTRYCPIYPRNKTGLGLWYDEIKFRASLALRKAKCSLEFDIEDDVGLTTHLDRFFDLNASERCMDVHKNKTPRKPWPPPSPSPSPLPP